MQFKRREYQKLALDNSRALYDKGVNRQVLIMATGTGKAQPLSEPVLTPNGWTTMGELRPGSEVVGSDGLPALVTGVYPQGVRDIARVTFSDGTYVRCDWDHLWAINTKSRTSRGHGLLVYKTRELKDAGLLDGSGASRWFLPKTAPIQYSTKPTLPLRPYLVGALIGDGGLKNGLMFSSQDDEVIVRVEKELGDLGTLFHVENCDYFVATGETGCKGSRLHRALVSLGLRRKGSHEKMIPPDYLVASIQERLDLLRGLMDTDGTSCGGGGSFTTTSKDLAEQVVELVRGLGYKTRGYRARHTTCLGITHRESYRIQFSGGYCPFHLSRKAKNWSGWAGRKAIVSIEDDGNEEAQCISVDATDRLYVTRGYNLTHNTITFASLPEQYPKLAKQGILILVHRDELVFQAADKFKKVNPGLTVGIEKAEYQADLSSDVIVASVQTLGHGNMSRLRPILREIPFGIIIVDECHHMRPGSQYDKVLNLIGIGCDPDPESTPLLRDGSKRLLFGVTATPNRHDKVGLSHFFDDIVLNYGIQEAVEEGYLTDVDHRIVKTGVDISSVKKRAGDFRISQLAEATNTSERNNIIVSAYLKYCDGHSALAFCADVEHAHTLAAVFRDAGVSAEAIDGETPKDLRRERLRMHESGELKIITNYGVLTEGYDGRVHSLLMARATKSQPLYIQMLGRGLRTIPADLGNLATKEERLEAIASSVKPACTLLDFVDAGHDVVTMPTLFGLKQDFDSAGSRMMGVTVKSVNSAIERNPMNADAIMGATSFEQVEVEATKINVWTMARSHEGLSDISDFKWMNVGTTTVQLEVPVKNGRKFLPRLDQDYLGNWQLSVIKPSVWSQEQGRMLPEEHATGRSFSSLEEAIRETDAHLRKRVPDSIGLIDRNARWRKGKPTAKQIKMLESYGIDAAGVRNKGDASDLITSAKAIGMKQSRRAFRHA